MLFALALLLALAPGDALAQGDEPTVIEEFTVKVNDVGDGRITDSIRYEPEDYEAVKNVEEENRGFLTRRFTAEDTIGEMTDFDVRFDDESSSVVITYDRPGFAYFIKGEFWIFGFPDEPEESSGNTFRFEDVTPINSEFTLFTDQVIRSTTTIELPEAAGNARYDQEEKAIRYEMPESGTLLGFWSENKTALSVVFSVLTLTFAGLLAFTATRKTPVGAAPGGENLHLPQAGSTLPPMAPAPVTPAAPPLPPQAQAADRGEQAAATAATQAEPLDKEHPVVTQVEARQPVAGGALFCRECGGRMTPGRKFCTGCGTES